MDTQELLLTAGRGAAVYFLMLVVVRMLGKRSIGAFSAFDLVVALMLGEVVDGMIYGEVTMLQGAVAVGSIALCQLAVEYLGFKSRRLDALFQGRPSVIVREGQVVPTGLAAERMSESDVHVQLRAQSIEDMREVKLALVEPNGSVSIIKRDWAEPVQKADLGGEAAEQKERDTGGQETPPEGQDTTSPRALQQRAA